MSARLEAIRAETARQFPAWVMPPAWSVPKLWPGERFFVLCGGESVRAVRSIIPHLQGRFVVVKEGIFLRPNAEVLLVGGESSDALAMPLFPAFERGGGRFAIARGRSLPTYPDYVKRVTRSKDHEHLCEQPTHVCGYDSGTSAINLAYHFGAREIVLIGYDMVGRRWFDDEEYNRLTGLTTGHPMPVIPEDHFRDHVKPLAKLAEDCRRKGVRVVNTSPVSRVMAFESQPLEAFL